MPMSDEMRKHLIFHNTIGLVNAGVELKEALEMAWDQAEPLFSKRLKLKRGGTSTAGGGASRSAYGGGTEGGATGG